MSKDLKLYFYCGNDNHVTLTRKDGDYYIEFEDHLMDMEGKLHKLMIDPEKAEDEERAMRQNFCELLGQTLLQMPEFRHTETYKHLVNQFRHGREFYRFFCTGEPVYFEGKKVGWLSNTAATAEYEVELGRKNGVYGIPDEERDEIEAYFAEFLKLEDTDEVAYEDLPNCVVNGNYRFTVNAMEFGRGTHDGLDCYTAVAKITIHGKDKDVTSEIEFYMTDKEKKRIVDFAHNIGLAKEDEGFTMSKLAEAVGMEGAGKFWIIGTKEKLYDRLAEFVDPQTIEE